jgi:hypothetical protein
MSDREPRVVTPSHNSDYFVAFRRKDTGVITWSVYPSQEEFESDLREFPDILKHEDVLARGVSEEECVELARSTPMSAYRESAFAEATGPDGINFQILSHKLTELNLMRSFGVIGDSDLKRDED